MADFADRATLHIDLDALAANWRKLRDEAAPAECAAVLKADGYGTGAAMAAGALWQAGCRRFFVAHAEEALALRPHLPQAAIHCLHGVPAGAADALAEADIVPVLSTPQQIERWLAEASRRARRLPAMLHVDTGMNRLGLSNEEFEMLLNGTALAGLSLEAVISHLACADEPEAPLNAEQARRFQALRTRLPGVKGSLANSAGIFLGPAFRHDLVRPGIALYGANPLSPSAGSAHGRSVMREVVRLSAPILRVARVDRPESVGYGATYRVEKPSQIATIGVGYADGFLRSLSNRGHAAIKGRHGYVRVPLVGRVSMDLITLDVSALAPEECVPGTMVDLIGGGMPLEEQAEAAGTIPYELLTSLGRRYRRFYTGQEGAA